MMGTLQLHGWENSKCLLYIPCIFKVTKLHIYLQPAQCEDSCFCSKCPFTAGGALQNTQGGVLQNSLHCEVFYKVSLGSVLQNTRYRQPLGVALQDKISLHTGRCSKLKINSFGKTISFFVRVTIDFSISVAEMTKMMEMTHVLKIKIKHFKNAGKTRLRDFTFDSSELTTTFLISFNFLDDSCQQYSLRLILLMPWLI